MLSLFSCYCIVLGFIASFIAARRNRRAAAFVWAPQVLAMFVYNALFEPILGSQHPSVFVSVKYLFIPEESETTPYWFAYFNWAFFGIQTLTTMQFVSYVQPGPKSTMWKVLVTYPSFIYSASVGLTFPLILISRLLFLDPPGRPWYPLLMWGGFLVISFLCVFQSRFTWGSKVGIRFDKALEHAGSFPRLRRANREYYAKSPEKVVKEIAKSGDVSELRIFQITDPHLGPFMSPERLTRIINDAISQDPHLILLTGDYITAESNMIEARPVLVEGFRALSEWARAGKVYACLGNHDHENYQMVTSVFEELGIPLLIDRETVVPVVLDSGRHAHVQLVGFDFYFLQQEQKIRELCTRFPPREEVDLRILLLHNPGHFKFIPETYHALVLSGHTHGGHIGLYSLGLRFSFTGLVIPDADCWAHGRNVLYVHKGTGHYGFPLRIGVPGEQSLCSIFFRHRSAEAVESAEIVRAGKASKLPGSPVGNLAHRTHVSAAGVSERSPLVAPVNSASVGSDLSSHQ